MVARREGTHVRGSRIGLITAALAASALGLTACDTVTSLARPSTPVVLTGAQVPKLVGTTPGRVVAFKHEIVSDVGSWTQVPVQVDERKVVAFGSQPGSNATAGVVGTVYGSGSGGPTALQYADPGTFVGADSNANVDNDDEIVFMSSDAGGKPRTTDVAEPAGVVAGSGTSVRVADPRGAGEYGFVFLFRSNGTLDPSAGEDYVDYDFTLTSGDYKTTYQRADGPNPETSTVRTDVYEAGFIDRWKETSWKVLAPGASGVDILDGHKNQFAISVCGRSNDTFSDAEGAFVANLDGPVRAIRSYIGANSGPLTQRTHVFYRDREDVITDLRVHAIPGIMDYLDLSASASGMTYRSSAKTTPVTVDGVADSVPTSVPAWEAYDGPQGQVWTQQTYSATAATTTSQYYRDAATTSETQCWGDSSLYGASGSTITSGIPNTDPRTAPFDTLRGVRVNEFRPPAADKAAIGTAAADWAADLTTPLVLQITAYAP
jgi:hypothetical protein